MQEEEGGVSRRAAGNGRVIQEIVGQDSPRMANSVVALHLLGDYYWGAMNKSESSPKRLAKYDGTILWLRVNGEDHNLGPIETRQGGLTREQKLRAVAGRGEWVKI